MHNFSRGRKAPDNQSFYQDVANTTTEQLNAYSASRKLKFLDMNWIIIKDDQKKHSPFRKKKTDIDIEKLKQDLSINDDKISVGGQDNKENKKSFIKLEKYEQEFAEEINALLTSKSWTKGGRGTLKKINDRRGMSFEAGYKEGSLDSDEESSTQQRIAEMARNHLASANSLDEKFERTMRSSGFQSIEKRSISVSKHTEKDENIARTLAKIAESEVAFAEEYKNSPIGKKQKRATLNTLSRLSKRASIFGGGVKAKETAYNQVNNTIGPKLKASHIYDSPLEFINNSMGIQDKSKGLFGRERKTLHDKKIEGGPEAMDYSNAVSVFDRTMNKESDIPASVLFKGADERGLIVTNEKNRRLKLPLSQGMAQFLQNFNERPGKKVYISDPDLENKIRNDEFAKKVITEVFEDFFVNPQSIRHPKRQQHGTQEAIMKPHVFPQTLRGYQKDDILSTSHDYTNKTEKDKAKSKSPNGKGSNDESKPLANLLYERFRSKLPDVHTNKLLRPSLNVYDHSKIALDNATSRQRNYDAWYIPPEKRIQRLKKYVVKTRDHSNKDRLNNSVL